MVVCLIALTFPLPLVSMKPFSFLFAKAAITGESVKIDDLLVLLLAAFLCGAAFEKGSMHIFRGYVLGSIAGRAETKRHR